MIISKKITVIVLFIFSFIMINSVVFARNWYVSTTGNDSWDGTYETPFRWPQKAVDSAVAGDRILIKGGIYYLTYSLLIKSWRGVQSGTESANIYMDTYEGDVYFDGTYLQPPYADEIMGITGVSYWHISHLNLRNSPNFGFIANGDTHNIKLYWTNSYNNYMSGFAISGVDNAVFSHCKAWNNYDALADGENADGFCIANGSDNTTLIYCAAYDNSDDGYDLWSSSNVYLYRCIASGSGRGAGGDGNGFKLGGPGSLSNRTYECIAFNNRACGFDDNACDDGLHQFNTSYNNGTYNFRFFGNDTIQFCIAYGGVAKNWSSSSTINDSYNTWNLAITDPLFKATSGSEMFHLQADSPCRDLIGPSRNDIGAFEYGEEFSIDQMPDSLIAYWPFDNSVNPGEDSTDNHDGTLNGGVSWLADGLINGGLEFNGTTGYIAIPSSSDFSSGEIGQMTISASIKADSYHNKQVIISRRHPNNNEGHFNIYVYQNRLYFSFYSNYAPVGTHFLYSDQLLEDGEAYQVVWQKKWNKLGTRLFVNGIEQTVYGDTDSKGTSYTNLPVFIGAENYSAGPRYFFDGIIDEVAIWNRILTMSELEEFTGISFNQY